MESTTTRKPTQFTLTEWLLIVPILTLALYHALCVPWYIAGCP